MLIEGHFIGCSTLCLVVAEELFMVGLVTDFGMRVVEKLSVEWLLKFTCQCVQPVELCVL